MSGRRYPSGLSDDEWRLLEPLFPPSRRGRPPKWPPRLLADAIFYVVRSGCAWRMLPGDFPPWRTVYSHFRRRWRGAPLRAAHDRLRRRVRRRVREAEGRAPEPSRAGP
jgi:putative transposase